MSIGSPSVVGMAGAIPVSAAQARLASVTEVVGNITLKEYYMGRDEHFSEELSDAHKANAAVMVEKANLLLNLFGKRKRVASGWRPASINAATKGASPTSKHVLCQALDFEDGNRELMNWCLNNKDLLEALGLWFEDPRDTPTWVHAQIVPPASGHLFFRA